MNKPVCILIILILIYLFYKRNSITESFYIKQIYNPSYLERNPLVCYVSEPEEYLDKSYFENVIGKKFPIRITTNKSDMFSADLALLPENIILEKKTKQFISIRLPKSYQGRFLLFGRTCKF